jgi:hypothetical protein
LVAYPDAQNKAHEEIDGVVGEHRMPSLEDLEHMPYIRAMILEVGWPTLLNVLNSLLQNLSRHIDSGR